jgi:mannose-6-phosphate isomerase class I
MFKQDHFQNYFSDLGYIVVPFIDEEAIEEIRNLYEETQNMAQVDSNFYTSIWSHNIDYKKKVDKELKALLSPFLDAHLNAYKTVFANFMVKKANENSALQPHQDWSFVDEEKYDSVTVWVPLVKVSAENGALEVLPKSNKLNNFKRARFLNSPFNEAIPFISKNLMKSIPLEKGEALFINSRTIHASPSNLSSSDRIAISIVLIPQSAELKHYLLNRENEMNYFP